MKNIYAKCSSIILSILLFLQLAVGGTYAIYDPLSKPNNMYGMHILFDSELQDASELINSNGGEWGYVTIPIQMGDYNLDKWQKFMDEAKNRKTIPIVRLMTDPYWVNSHYWRIPDRLDIIDMANFLNSLNWPIENRYVIVFNEMNRYDEWGGEFPNPEEYADILDFTIQVFKDRNTDFFVIMGGLDNAAPDDGVKHMDSFTYLEKMAEYKPDVFRKIDGFSSHSYPNPGFQQPPSNSKVMGTSTYKHEYNFIAQVAGSPKPVFITETGWDARKLSAGTIADYYKYAFKEIWEKDKDKIVAVTPFLLKSHGGFDEFSFIVNEQKTPQYTAIHELQKTAGTPTINIGGIGGPTAFIPDVKGLEDLPEYDESFTSPLHMTQPLKDYFKLLLGI